METRNDLLKKQAERQDRMLDLLQHCSKISTGIDNLASNSGDRAIWELVQNAKDLSEECYICMHLTKERFVFKHKGMPFNYETLMSLIKQVSSSEKQFREKNSDGLPKVGQYGTGFLTTHAFSRKFAERLIALPNPVILFTHNIWLRNYLLDNKKKVHKYSVNSLLTDRVDAAKRHLMSYMVLSIGKEKGAVDGSDNESAAYYLAAAKRAIDTVPFTAVEVESATQLLRKSVEMLVDEKVFLNLEPCKFRGNHQNILWDELLDLKQVPDATIQTLQEQYNVLSSAGTHVGMAAAEDALDHDDLEDVYYELIAIA